MTEAARIEIRAAAEVRAASGRRLEGVCAVYGTPTTLAGGVVETIRAGAFAESIRSGDILFLADHDPARVLGRTRSGTLTLRDTPGGLAFSLALPDTSAARDILALAERGDLGGASIGMRVRNDRWDGNRREVVAAELVECSAVSSFPAYPQTQVVARARLPVLTASRAAAVALRRRLVGAL